MLREFIFSSKGRFFFRFFFIKIIINNQYQQRKKKQSSMDEQCKKNIKNIENKDFPRESVQKEVFQCQCGKQYQSFAAIYLHFRTKHDIKLSTKPNEIRRKISQQEGQRKFVYSLDNEENQILDNKTMMYQIPGHHSPGSTSINSVSSALISHNSTVKLKQCVDNYLISSNQSPKWIYRMLTQFLSEEWEENKDFSIEKIPLSLNRFVLDFIPQSNKLLRVRSSTWKKLCLELQKFCRWLREQKLTDFIVVYQDNQEK